ELLGGPRARIHGPVVGAFVTPFPVHGLRRGDDNQVDVVPLAEDQLVEERGPDRIRPEERREVRQVILIRSYVIHNGNTPERPQHRRRIRYIPPDELDLSRYVVR